MQIACAPARSMTSNDSMVSAMSLPSSRPQPDRRTPTRFAMRVGLPRRRGKSPAGDDRRARAPREAQVMLEVVDAREPVVQQLLGPEEVREVAPAVGRAALARAA